MQLKGNKVTDKLTESVCVLASEPAVASTGRRDTAPLPDSLPAGLSANLPASPPTSRPPCQPPGFPPSLLASRPAQADVPRGRGRARALSAQRGSPAGPCRTLLTAAPIFQCAGSPLTAVSIRDLVNSATQSPRELPGPPAPAALSLVAVRVFATEPGAAVYRSVDSSLSSSHSVWWLPLVLWCLAGQFSHSVPRSRALPCARLGAGDREVTGTGVWSYKEAQQPGTHRTDYSILDVCKGKRGDIGPL